MSGALSFLGLVRKAGALAVGEQAVAEAAQERRARLVLLASDAGETTAQRVRRLEGEKLPVIELAEDRAALGGAVGFAAVAAVAVCELGFAAALAEKLAGENPQAARAAELLAPRRDKAARRKADTAKYGKKSSRKKP